MPQPEVLLVGSFRNTHLGGSLSRAAEAIGVASRPLDVEPAFAGPLLARRLLWRFGGRRPFRLAGFSQEVVRAATQEGVRAVLATGAAPIARAALEELRHRGVRCLNYSTDDPWNPAVRAGWYLDALPAYDVVFTPRRANVEDFMRLGCRDVRYLPFGYDERLFPPGGPASTDAAAAPEILFVGGADNDRAAFFGTFRDSGLHLTLVGGYWERFPALCELAIGQRNAVELRELTVQAAVNVCLVRRANRDGHVMRSFEIPAVGGFMIAEDTADHRELFGEEGRCVLYFATPEQAIEKSRWALAHPVERRRMAATAHARITGGRHSYRDRLQSMLEVVSA